MWPLIVVPALIGAKTLRSEGFAYDYSKSGQDWAQGMCSSRERQSPINFRDLTSPPSGKLSFSYQIVSSAFELSNNGHTYAANFAGLGYGGITYENGWYNLMNVNVHAPSEHTFQGNHYPLELHLVHKKYDSDALLIVAIPVAGPIAAGATQAPPTGAFVQEKQPLVPAPAPAPVSAPAPAPAPASLPPSGPPLYVPPDPSDPGFSPQLQHFLTLAPPLVHQIRTLPVDEADPLDLNTFLTNGIFFEYGGSLTAPPCAEIATWFVRREPIIASEAQIGVFHNAVYQMTAAFGNARSPMPINGRPIAVRAGVKDEPPPQAPELSIPVDPNPRTDREFRAMKWARDALKIAKTATDYVKDLDFRLRNAAQAHADALAPDVKPMKHTARPTSSQDTTVGAAPDMDMHGTSASIARSINEAAQQAIASASQQITEEAQIAAQQAAQQDIGVQAQFSPAAAPPPAAPAARPQVPPAALPLPVA
eukprot:GEMP01033305.1.p1 GENE.GEMP01033305.1~~GEMP01033305.1.p1  ORF type:complete len:478 (+),score=121.50 GEMP01033305.1:265-1698(+)